ncbi:hypothetical protein LOK49_LG12G01211 [Camellia lanceoleosa]|uniref:Uncharacterized protein n=1 Tax=Camellia lanceoleosa TaxID=1840588 RepID=A0ACC0FP92_9ERIC|nr:hypothetical protein LOK49_LG12G01211 [Camellia lanceoleosa]
MWILKDYSVSVKSELICCEHYSRNFLSFWKIYGGFVDHLPVCDYSVCSYLYNVATNASSALQLCFPFD